MSSTFPGIRGIMASRGGFGPQPSSVPLGSVHLSTWAFSEVCVLPSFQVSSSFMLAFTRVAILPPPPPPSLQLPSPSLICGCLPSHQPQGTPRSASSCHRAHAVVGPAGRHFIAPVSYQGLKMLWESPLGQAAHMFHGRGSVTTAAAVPPLALCCPVGAREQEASDP